MKMPPMPLLIGRNAIDDSLFCNETVLQQRNINCVKEFCECTHVVQIPLNSTVELIFIDEGHKYDANHPFHLHGYGFRVVGMERLQSTGININEV